MKTILVHPNVTEYTFIAGKKGHECVVTLHGVEWPPELRANPPRLRLLEDCRGAGEATLCEVLGDWPGAPDYWPPEWKPGTTPSPFGIHAGHAPIRGKGIYPKPAR